MAMSFAYAVMESPEKETLDGNYLYYFYGAWTKSKPIDIGYTVKDSYKKFDFYKHHPNHKKFQEAISEFFSHNYKSLSNGFLMRKSTFIAWIYYRFYYEVESPFNNIKGEPDVPRPVPML